jgi:hypothetical protein
MNEELEQRIADIADAMTQSVNHLAQLVADAGEAFGTDKSKPIVEALALIEKRMGEKPDLQPIAKAILEGMAKLAAPVVKVEVQSAVPTVNVQVPAPVVNVQPVIGATGWKFEYDSYDRVVSATPVRIEGAKNGA